MTHKLAIALMATVSVAALAGTPSRAADTKDMKIALSNNYAGNSWRQSMLKSWGTVTKKAVDDHVVAAADAFTTAENQATEQAAQIQNMILQGYNAIVIDAASPTALNGAVKQACDAGIVVVSLRRHRDRALRLPDRGRFQEARLNADRPISSNAASRVTCLEIRGHRRRLRRRRDPRRHRRCRGQGSRLQDRVAASTATGPQTVAQKEVAGVLPTLPPIVAVATPGRRRLRGRASLQGGGPPHSRDLPRQPGGRTHVVEAAEGSQRLRDYVGLHRAGFIDLCVLGRAEDPGRRDRAEGPDAASSRW